MRTALVVDDSKTARVILGSMLERHDLAVDTAETAEQALDYLRHHRPDVIFMDHQMPGMDGLEAVREIKNDPNTAMIPIMMYTAKQGEVYLGQARALGAIGILSKQVRPAEVFNVLRSLGLVTERRASESADVEDPGVEDANERQDAFSPEPTPEEFARRTAEHVEAKILRAHFPALIDGHLSGIRQEMARLREDMACAFEASARPSARYDTKAPVSELTPDELRVAEPSAGGRWLRRLTTGAVVALLGVLAWVGVQFTAPEPTSAHAGQTNQSLLSTVEWSLNRSGEYQYGQAPFSDNRLEMLKDLLLQLTWSQFRGTLEISGHMGRYCLEGGPASGFKMADPALEMSLCARIGQPPDVGQAMAEAMSDRFASYLDYLQELPDPPIKVVISSFGDEHPMQAYPDLSEVKTAGEWNRIARINTRIEFKFVPDLQDGVDPESRSIRDLLPW